MKKINVKIIYPWVFPDSPFYKFLFDYPPKNIHYLNPTIRSKDVTTKARTLLKKNNFKETLRKAFFATRIPLPNVRFPLSKNEDLMHCAHCLAITNKPWVADFEISWQLTLSRIENKGGTFLAKQILKQKSCKRIICWTEQVKKDLTKHLSNSKDVCKKLTVVYPAVPAQKITKQKNSVNIVFVARYFEAKGGNIAISAIDVLSKKYPFVTGTIVSDTPKTVIDKYSKNKKIKFLPLMDRKQLFNKVYKKASIFAYPGTSDSFGFGFLDAMSFGLPIVTVNGFARNEIVTDNKTGFIIQGDSFSKEITEKEKIQNEFTKKLEMLVIDKALRVRFGKNAFKEIKEGKFSIKERNKQLEEIYYDSIN